MRACVRAFKIGLVASVLGTAALAGAQEVDQIQFSDFRLYLVRVEENLPDSSRKVATTRENMTTDFELPAVHYRVTVLDSCEPVDSEVLTIHRNQSPLVAVGTRSSVLQPVIVGQNYMVLGRTINETSRTFISTDGLNNFTRVSDYSVAREEIAAMLMFPVAMAVFPDVISSRYLFPHQIAYGQLASAINVSDPASVVGGCFTLKVLFRVPTDSPSYGYYRFNPIGQILIPKANGAERESALLLLCLARHYFGEVDPEQFLTEAEAVSRSEPKVLLWDEFFGTHAMVQLFRPPHDSVQFRLNPEQRERVEKLKENPGGLGQFAKLMFGP